MFNQTDWYWRDDAGRLYSSRAQALVQESSPEYLEWRERLPGWDPTPWPRDEAGEQTDASLAAVLEPYGLAGGLSPAPGAAPIADVSSAQAKIQLSRTGFLTPVKESIAAIGGEVEIWFTEARTWQRKNPHVVEIGAGLNLSPAEIDELFRAAAQIDA